MTFKDMYLKMLNLKTKNINTNTGQKRKRNSGIMV